jgi:hypothetical protein
MIWRCQQGRTQDAQDDVENVGHGHGGHVWLRLEQRRKAGHDQAGP